MPGKLLCRFRVDTCPSQVRHELAPKSVEVEGPFAFVTALAFASSPENTAYTAPGPASTHPVKAANTPPVTITA